VIVPRFTAAKTVATLQPLLAPDSVHTPPSRALEKDEKISIAEEDESRNRYEVRRNKGIPKLDAGLTTIDERLT